MKNFTFILPFIFMGCCLCNAQNNVITFVYENNTHRVKEMPSKADFSTDIRVVQEGTCAGFKITKVNRADTFTITTSGSEFVISGIPETSEEIKINVTCNGTSPKNELTIKRVTKEKDTEEVPVPDQNQGKGNTKYDSEYNYLLSTNPDFNNRAVIYDRKKNLARYFFNKDGILLSMAPVNIDANDYYEVSMIVPKVDQNKYYMTMDCEYNPSDLSQRITAIIDKAGSQSGGDSQIEYVKITQTFSPCTDNAKILFYKDGVEMANHYDIKKINSLHHYELAASFVSTDLINPEFDVFPLNATQNTIREINNSKRTMVTFNVIFYWKPTIEWIKKLSKNKENDDSNVTDGRDVYKEATFWERLNPTFGVALNNAWDENFFMGGTFEFARGGNLTAGWHYGKVTQLSDENFKLGQDVFTGAKDDIKVTDAWKWGFYFGITLDARIFNSLFARN
ncbi:hypothetical protein [Flavobacterium cerinum]|uniref:Uncharacterized protein n=1 Tax=Flavobacterium cerinum TaxID=2502784 RepID=A0A3S3U1Y4_9FLAO|nr:hypothetical protein [Flavobacterium cerinum]RWX02272.1 hypothetical protein EPI11_03380 [Flavobacterium cerinum]